MIEMGICFIRFIPIIRKENSNLTFLCHYDVQAKIKSKIKEMKLWNFFKFPKNGFDIYLFEKLGIIP